MISPETAKDWVGRAARIRVHAGAAGLQDHVMAEGRVVSYADGPTVGIEHDDGSRSSWMCSLPIVEIEGMGDPSQMVYERGERVRHLIAAVDRVLAIVQSTTPGSPERYQAYAHLRAVRERTHF